MTRPEVVLLSSGDGLFYAGHVKYNDNWFEEYQEGKSPALLEIVFSEDKVPDYLVKEDIPEVVEYANKEFKDKMGITWEEYCERPERGLRRKANIIDE